MDELSPQRSNFGRICDHFGPNLVFCGIFGLILYKFSRTEIMLPLSVPTPLTSVGLYLGAPSGPRRRPVTVVRSVE